MSDDEKIIVAWLRGCAKAVVVSGNLVEAAILDGIKYALAEAADGIERGEHREDG